MKHLASPSAFPVGPRTLAKEAAPSMTPPSLLDCRGPVIPWQYRDLSVLHALNASNQRVPVLLPYQRLSSLLSAHGATRRLSFAARAALRRMHIKATCLLVSADRSLFWLTALLPEIV